MKKSRYKPANDIFKLGDIFRKLNVGLPIEHLSIKEIEFLNKFYGEEWKAKVKRLLVS